MISFMFSENLITTRCLELTLVYVCTGRLAIVYFKGVD